MANVGPSVWYCRDNSTTPAAPTTGSTPGSIGWSAVTGWSTPLTPAAGALRRQSGAAATGTICTIATTVLTVGGSLTGTWTVGQVIAGVGVTAGTTIISLGTGTGGAGTYNISVSQTVSVGEAMSAAFLAGNERVFVCIVSGAVGATEPNWVLTKGATTTDGSATWQEVTGQPGVNGDLVNTPTWAQQHASSVAVTKGFIIQDAAGDCLFIVGTAGNIGASEPTWNKTAGVTTTDNTVTWYSIGAPSNFAAWAAPFARAAAAWGTSWASTNNALRVGDDHSETQASANTVTPTGATGGFGQIISVDHTTSPPNTAALKAGATIATTGNNALSINGTPYAYGLTLPCGSGANAPNLNFGATNVSESRADTCAFQLNGTVTGQTLQFGGTSSRITATGCTLQVGHTGASITVTGRLTLQSASPFFVGGTVPATLFATSGGPHLVDGLDLSPLGAGTIVAQNNNALLTMQVRNCKIASNTVLSTAPNCPSSIVDFIDCDSGGTNYTQSRFTERGTMSQETVVVRTGGASDGTTPLSHKIATTANSVWLAPFQDLQIGVWNSITGTNRNVTLYGIWNAAALPNNDDIWPAVEYFGSASSPLASFASGTKANVLAANAAWTADTSAWDSLVTARANTTAYSLGNVIKVASNPGRIFFCTTAGTSAGSEPGGYATAVDGGSVTDGGATFRAGVRFSMAVTLSAPQPAMAGPILVTMNAAKASSTFWIDQKIGLS